MVRRAPYRWTKRPLANIRSWMHDLRNGVRQVYRWLPIIWFDKDWDWYFLAKILEFKLRVMSKSANGWITCCHERHARQMLICATILRRMYEDNYLSNTEKRWKTPLNEWGYPEIHKFMLQHAEQQQKNERELLGKILSHHMVTWWE